MTPAPAASFGGLCGCTLWVYETETQDYTFVGLAEHQGPGFFSISPAHLRWLFPSVIGQRRYLVRYCKGWCTWDKYTGLPVIQDEW